jgi:hypothetical protein
VDLVKLDCKRKNKASNDDWESPHDLDARIAKMKEGRTHLRHKSGSGPQGVQSSRTSRRG